MREEPSLLEDVADLALPRRHDHAARWGRSAPRQSKQGDAARAPGGRIKSDDRIDSMVGHDKGGNAPKQRPSATAPLSKEASKEIAEGGVLDGTLSIPNS